MNCPRRVIPPSLARRSLNQKDTLWKGKEKTEAMLISMGAGVDGRIAEARFVEYFLRVLGEEDPDAFATSIGMFLACAASLKDEKEEERLTQNREEARQMRRAYVKKQKEDKAVAKAALVERKKAYEDQQKGTSGGSGSKVSGSSTPASSLRGSTGIEGFQEHPEILHRSLRGSTESHSNLGIYDPHSSLPSSTLSSAESSPVSTASHGSPILGRARSPFSVSRVPGSLSRSPRGGSPRTPFTTEEIYTKKREKRERARQELLAMGHGQWGNKGTLIFTNVLLRVFGGLHGFVRRREKREAVLTWKEACRKVHKEGTSGFNSRKSIAASPADEKALRKEEAQRLKAERQQRNKKNDGRK